MARYVGQTGAGLTADGTGSAGVPDGVVDQFDYDLWKSHFGKSIGGGPSAAAVPESPTSLLLLAGILTVCSFLRSSWCKSADRTIRA